MKRDIKLNYKEKLQELGLIKKEVWILPEHFSQLKLIEHKLRKKGLIMVENKAATQGVAWTRQSLCEALGMSEESKEGVFSLEVSEGLDPVIIVKMEDYPELPVYVSVTREQILSMIYLWNTSEIKDVNVLNDELLRVNPIIPLSDFGIMGNSYVLFGSLSVESNIREVIKEIITLVENSLEAIETYSDFLVKN